MTSTAATFTIVFGTPRTFERTDVDPKLAFWRPFLRRADRSDTDIADVLEQRVRFELGRRLTEHLRSFSGSTTEQPSVERPSSERREERLSSERRNEPVFFRVEAIRYGSMSVDVAAEPLKNLVEFFDSNFEYFEAFLSSYVPLSFQEAIDSYPIANWDAEILDMPIEIRPSTALTQAFESRGSLAGRRLNDKETKARWLWIASNTSLIIPTAIAAFFAYYFANRAFDWIEADRSSLLKLVDLQQTSIHSLEAQLTDLVKTTSAHPCCCSTAAPPSRPTSRPKTPACIAPPDSATRQPKP